VQLAKYITSRRIARLLFASILVSCAVCAESGDKNSTVQPRLVTLPHIVEGANWTTSITLVNTGRTTQQYKLVFFNNDGQPAEFSFERRGRMRTIVGNLWEGASTLFVTEATGPTLNQGWATLDLAETGEDIALGPAVFGTSGIPGRPALEATVPPSSGLDSQSWLPFNNLDGYTTSIAILNPGSQPVSVPILVSDFQGAPVGGETLTLAPGQKIAFPIMQRWGNSGGKVGVIRFQADDSTPLSILGLRFNSGGSFTTILPLKSR
jgi:hypothetical protein